MLTYESFTPGETVTYGHVEITRQSIIDFASLYDPQPFHLDEAAARASILGGLSASGWQTACALMRMSCDGFINQSASWGGPGVKALKWLKPVCPGDVLSARRTLLSKRLSQSRPEMGLLDWHFDVMNQHGEVVMTQDNVIMVGLAGKTPPPAPQRTPVPQPHVPVQPPAILPGWYEDVVVGQTTPLGQHVFERDAIIAFARQHDPQPFHLDEAAAARSHFGALVASGWHTAVIWMRHTIAARQAFDATQKSPPQPGPSPGLTDLKWPRPVFAGDRLSYATQVLHKRETSRPGWGLVTALNTADNQAGERVFEFTSAVFTQMRGS